MTTLGDMLIRARRDAGLTAHDVSMRTHIMQSTIYNLEGDKLDVLKMSEGYIRGYILSYCKICSVDPAPYIEQFERQKGGTQRTSVEQLPQAQRDFKPLNHRPEQELNWKIIAGVVVVIAALAIGIFAFNSGDDDFVPGSNPLPAEIPPTLRTSAETAVPADLRIPFSFSIEAIEGRASQVQVIIDGSLAFDGVLTSGDTDSAQSFTGVLEAEIEVANPENVIVLQGDQPIPINEDGLLTLTASEE